MRQMATFGTNDATNEPGKRVQTPCEVTCCPGVTQLQKGIAGGLEDFLLSVMAGSSWLVVVPTKPVLDYHAVFLAKSPAKSVR